LERSLGGHTDGAFWSLPHDELERLVAAEEHLLGVAVRARVREQALETQEDAEPAFVADRGHVGRDAHEIDSAVDGLPRPEEHALAKVVVRAAGRGEVDRQVWDRRVRRGHRSGHDAVDVQVGGEVPVGLFEQDEGEVELGLGNPLAEVEVDAIGHVLASERTRPSGKAKRATEILGDTCTLPPTGRTLTAGPRSCFGPGYRPFRGPTAA
jgi:hypothetical protein